MQFAKNNPLKALYIILISNFVNLFLTGDAVCSCAKMPVVERDKNFVIN